MAAAGPPASHMGAAVDGLVRGHGNRLGGTREQAHGPLPAHTVSDNGAPCKPAGPAGQFS